jgi:hypothetical protein
MGFAALYPSYSELPILQIKQPRDGDRAARRNSLGSGDDGVGVDAVARRMGWT